MGQSPSPQSVPKTTSPPTELGGKTPTLGSQHALIHWGKIRRHLVTVLTLKSLEIVFA